MHIEVHRFPSGCCPCDIIHITPLVNILENALDFHEAIIGCPHTNLTFFFPYFHFSLSQALFLVPDYFPFDFILFLLVLPLPTEPFLVELQASQFQLNLALYLQSLLEDLLPLPHLIMLAFQLS